MLLYINEMNKEVEWLKKCIQLGMVSSSEGSEQAILDWKKLCDEYRNFNISEISNVEQLLMESLETNDRIFILSRLIQHLQDKTINKILLNSIIEGDFDCIKRSLLELQIVAQIETGYSLRKKIHEKNVNDFVKILGENRTYIPIKERKKKRLVIITEQILGINHAPTRMVLDIIYVLQEKLGYEVMLFVTPLNGALPIDLWYHGIVMNRMRDLDNAPLNINYKGITVRGYQIALQDGVIKEYKMMNDIIYFWKPYFVFNIGVVNPLADTIGRFTTLVDRSVSTACPVTNANIIVRSSKKIAELDDREICDVLKLHSQKQVYMENKFPVIIKKEECQISRVSENIPEEKFLIGVVGNRLDEEIDSEFVNVLENITSDNENVIFIFIGQVNLVKKLLEKLETKNKIIYLGFRKDLMQVYGLLDLYLNPKRIGGGFSSSMALQADLPVVTLPDCDVAFNVGEDFCVDDYDEMVKIVKAYATDKMFYQKMKEKVKENKKRYSEQMLVEYVDEMISKIICCMEEANANDTIQ